MPQKPIKMIFLVSGMKANFGGGTKSEGRSHKKLILPPVHVILSLENGKRLKYTFFEITPYFLCSRNTTCLFENCILLFNRK